jgi:hypothetical protein
VLLLLLNVHSQSVYIAVVTSEQLSLNVFMERYTDFPRILEDRVNRCVEW